MKKINSQKEISTTKLLIIILILLFLIANIIFCLIYVFTSEENQSKPKIIHHTEIEYLKQNINFNKTSYENKGEVHFYYPSFFKNIHYSYKANNNSIKINNESENCDYFFDQKNLIFVDSNNSICKHKFDITNTNCCIEDESKNITNDNDCNEIKCCKYEYLCISKCITNLNSFKNCRERCRMNHLTAKLYYPYCFIQEEDVPLLNISILLTKYINNIIIS